MSHKNKLYLDQQVDQKLYQMNRAGFGRSKHKDKQAKYEAAEKEAERNLKSVQHKMTSDQYADALKRETKRLYKKKYQYAIQKQYIYSWNTFQTYKKWCIKFVTYCKEKYKCKTLKQCRQYADEWLLTHQNDSAYSQATYRAALAKLYDSKSTDFVPTPKRIRKDITRSRKVTERDRHFSEAKNHALVSFCKGSGLRASCIEQLEGKDLLYPDDPKMALWNDPASPYYLGYSAYGIRVKRGKGGKTRYVPILPEYEEEIVSLMKNTPIHDKVFEKINRHADIHDYRADYATALYKKLARPIDEIPFDRINRGSGHRYQSDVYICRGDQKGIKLDKAAMKKVSIALGHNRISVVGEHYAHKIQSKN